MKQNFNRRTYKKILDIIIRPHWFLFFMFIPIAAISFAAIQTVFYNISRNSLDKILNNSYYSLIINNKEYLLTALFFMLILYVPYIIPLIKIEVKKKNLFNEIITEICHITIALIIVKGMHILFKIDEVVSHYLFVGILLIILFRILSIKWIGGSIVGIARVFITFIVSTIYITVIFLIIVNKLAPISQLIFEGLRKDLVLISILYILLVTFSTWVISKFSPDSRKIRLNKFPNYQYIIPISLTLLFICISIFIWKQEQSWLDNPKGLEQTSRNIYEGEIKKKIESEGMLITQEAVENKFRECFDKHENNIYNFHHDHIYWRSVYCLLLGLVVSTAFATTIKVGAHYFNTHKREDE